MGFLDIRTIIFSYVITDLVSTLVVVLLWRQNRRRFAGSHWLALDFLLQTLALMLIVARGAIPDFVSVNLSNLMAMTGCLLGLVGLQDFFGRRTSQLPNIALIAVFFAVHCWYTLGQPDLAMRNLDLSLTMLLLFAQCAWLLLGRVPAALRGTARGVGLVFCAYAAVNLLRIGEHFLRPHSGGDYLHSGPFEAGVMLAYQMLFILLTYTLTLMFNRRLSQDIAAGEEKYSKAFHSSPYALILSRLADGRIIEVNRGFSQISGYAAGQAIGRTSTELGFWEDDDRRGSLVAELEQNSRVQGRVMRFRTKDGRLRTTFFSAELLDVAGEACLLSSIEDISDRMRNEEALRETTQYLESLLRYASAPIIVWDQECRITIFNHASEKLTGRSCAEVAGKELDFLFPEPSREASLECIRQTSHGGRLESVELEIGHRDGTVSTVLWNSANIHDPDGALRATIAQGQDITSRKQAEGQVSDLLREKDLILREVHHRIKNNMNTISGLLWIQAEGQDNPQVAGILKMASGRVRSMMLLYDKLYRSEATGMLAIQEYLPALVREIVAIFPGSECIRVETKVDALDLAVRFVSPLGIIINELITNAMKYAFVPDGRGTISVSLQQAGERIRLTVADDGRGLPEGFRPETATGFGLQLVGMLVQQIQGTLRIENGQGTRFILEFSAA